MNKWISSYSKIVVATSCGDPSKPRGRERGLAVHSTPHASRLAQKKREE
jgi:hypothetical protein